MGTYMVPVAINTNSFRMIISFSNNPSRMRKQPLLVVALMAMTSLTGCFGLGSDTVPAEVESENEPLRINHIQMKGTHNSYHVEPLISPTREYAYTHQTLDFQASHQGDRRFEIDVWWAIREGLRVYHNQ